MRDSMLGKVFALCDAEDQAAFLNAAGHMLRRSCDAEYYAELQLSRIADKLDSDGKWLLEKLARFSEPSP